MGQRSVLIKKRSLPGSYIVLLRREANLHHYDLFSLMSAYLTIFLIQDLLHGDSSLLVHFELKNIQPPG